MEVFYNTFKILSSVNRGILQTTSHLNTVKYSRNIVTTTMNLNKVEEELKANPYFDKYADKITKLQKSAPEEYFSRLETVANEKKCSNDFKKGDSLKLELKPGVPKPNSSVSYTKKKLLNDIMKVDLILNKSADYIQQIWKDYHTNKNTICASIPVNTYDLIMERSKLYPTFLLPLPRNQGYEFVLCQFSANEVHFTPLISYQTHKENAPDCLCIVYYDDLRNEKNIVLMRGEYNKDIINAAEAQCLANELHLYYAENNEKRTKLMQRFTNCPSDFKHMDLIANIETLTM